MSEGKNTPPLSMSAMKSAQRRRLPTKAVGQERETDNRKFFFLSLYYNLPALVAHINKFQPVRYFVIV